MSTHLEPHHHPYRRGRGLGSSGRRRHRRLRQPVANQTSTMESDADQGGCIDLTANDTLDEDVIDLTDSTLSTSYVNDAPPVVLISPTDVQRADNVRGGTSRRRQPVIFPDIRSDDEDVEGIIEVEQEPAHLGSSESRVTRNSSAISVEDSDDDLPDVPFAVSSSSSEGSSRASAKVTCPVCLDTDVQIRRDRQLYSTVCGHIFCSSCIKQAISSQQMCPTCRKRLTKRQIHQIYL